MNRLFAMAGLLAGFSVSAQDLVIEAQTLYPADGSAPVSGALVLVEDGKISAVGSAASMTIPAGVPTLSAEVVTPGLIDARTMVGLSGAFNVSADQDHDETTDTNTSQLRALDGFNLADPLLAYVRALGVTMVHVSPGEGNPIAGQTGVFKTAGTTVDDAALRPVAAMAFNLGEQPKAVWGEKGKAPYTRMAIASQIRQALASAQAPAAENDGVDLKRDALRQVVSGQMPAIFSAHREDDIATAMRLCAEFKMRCWLAYATEGYLARDAIAKADMPVIVGPPLQRLEGLEAYNATVENAALLHAAGIPVVFGTHFESYVPKNRVLLWEMTIAVANGLDPAAAIAAATIEPAKLLGIDDRVGSIEVGKDADLVLYNGDPFEYTSHVTHVLIDGVIVSDDPR